MHRSPVTEHCSGSDWANHTTLGTVIVHMDSEVPQQGYGVSSWTVSNINPIQDSKKAWLLGGVRIQPFVQPREHEHRSRGRGSYWKLTHDSVSPHEQLHYSRESNPSQGSGYWRQHCVSRWGWLYLASIARPPDPAPAPSLPGRWRSKFQKPISITRVSATKAPVLSHCPSHIAPYGSSCRWWAHRETDLCLCFQLDPTRMHGHKPGHQAHALACWTQPQGCLQSGPAMGCYNM